jgi:hypothetical protein
VRLIWAVEFVVDQPAARNPGVFKMELLTLMRRSPTPSLIAVRYEVRNCQIVKLERKRISDPTVQCHGRCGELWQTYSSF